MDSQIKQNEMDLEHEASFSIVLEKRKHKSKL